MTRADRLRLRVIGWGLRIIERRIARLKKQQREAEELLRRGKQVMWDCRNL